MEKKRLDYLDMAKGIGIILVLMGHLQGDPFYSYSPIFQPMCVFIFSFHMPLFFIISGILLAVKNDDSRPFKEIAAKRFRQIMIPYYWFSAFYLVYVLYYVLITHTVPWSSFFLNLWYVICGYGMNVLWFLPALFLGELVFIALRQKSANDRRFIAAIVILSAATLIISYLLTIPDGEVLVYKRIREVITVLLRPFIVAGFMTIGYYAERFCRKDNAIAKFLNKPELNKNGRIKWTYRLAYILIGLSLMGICLAFSHVNNGIDVRTLVFRNIFFFLLCALTGSFGLIILCKGLGRNRIICYWGTGSLIFMATHNLDFILALALKAAMYVNQYLTRARGYISYAVVVAVITLFCTLMIFIIQNYLPFIIGRPRVEKTK